MRGMISEIRLDGGRVTYRERDPNDVAIDEMLRPIYALRDAAIAGLDALIRELQPPVLGPNTPGGSTFIVEYAEDMAHSVLDAGSAPTYGERLLGEHLLAATEHIRRLEIDLDIKDYMLDSARRMAGLA